VIETSRLHYLQWAQLWSWGPQKFLMISSIIYLFDQETNTQKQTIEFGQEVVCESGGRGGGSISLFVGCRPDGCFRPWIACPSGYKRELNFSYFPSGLSWCVLVWTVNLGYPTIDLPKLGHAVLRVVSLTCNRVSPLTKVAHTWYRALGMMYGYCSTIRFESFGTSSLFNRWVICALSQVE